VLHDRNLHDPVSLSSGLRHEFINSVESSSLLDYAEDVIRSRKRKKKREGEKERENRPVYFPSDSLHFTGFTKNRSHAHQSLREKITRHLCISTGLCAKCPGQSCGRLHPRDLQPLAPVCCRFETRVLFNDRSCSYQTRFGCHGAKFEPISSIFAGRINPILPSLA